MYVCSICEKTVDRDGCYVTLIRRPETKNIGQYIGITCNDCVGDLYGGKGK